MRCMDASRQLTCCQLEVGVFIDMAARHLAATDRTTESQGTVLHADAARTVGVP